MRLRAKRIGQAVDAQPAREPGELGGVAQGGDMADLPAADEDRPTARHQDALAREQHLVFVLESA